jgi:acetyl-CoA carboxylase biotin carboxyl carrier protein
MTYQKESEEELKKKAEKETTPISQNSGNQGSEAKQDLERLRGIANILEESCQLSEIEYSSGDFQVRMVKHHPRSGLTGPVIRAESDGQQPTVGEKIAPVQHKDPVTSSVSSDDYVKSPMVGTVYLSPKPGDAPFVTIDSMIQEGQPILIIEAMKTMNTIKANKSGCIRKILVKNGDPVEFGQPLICIE